MKKFVKNDEPKKRKKKVEKGNNYKKRCDGDHTFVLFSDFWNYLEKERKEK